jgi:AmpD protein
MISQDKNFLTMAKFVASPHFNDRPDPNDVNAVIVHGISLPPSQFSTEYIEDFFLGKLNPNHHPYFATIESMRVSSHLLIDREGDVIQFVPFTKRAWHAGESILQDRTNCNDFSIGIELIGTDEIPYEEKQYVSLAKVLNILQKTFPGITRQRIVGHSDIAPGRKTDPGPMFNWNYLDCLLIA